METSLVQSPQCEAGLLLQPHVAFPSERTFGSRLCQGFLDLYSCRGDCPWSTIRGGGCGGGGESALNDVYDALVEACFSPAVATRSRTEKQGELRVFVLFASPSYTDLGHYWEG